MKPSPTKNESPAANGQVAKPKTKRMTNGRLLVGTLVVILVLAPSVYFWYSLQMKWTATAMLERAGKLANERDDAKAAQYYFRYLKLQPADAGVQVLLAETFDRTARDVRGKAQAIEYYYQALGVANTEKQRELRCRLTELLLQLQRFVTAEGEARELLKRTPNDPQGWRLLALSLYGECRNDKSPRGKDSASVGEAFEQAHQHNPNDVEIAVILAWLYRNEPTLLSGKRRSLSDTERGRLADQVMDQMITANPKSTTAYLARYQYRLRHDSPDAREDLARALEYGANDVNVLLHAAYRSRRDGEDALRKNGSSKDAEAHWVQARKYYEHAIDVSPREEIAYLGLGDLYVAENKPDLAIETWRRGIEKGNKESIDLNFRLADLMITLGRVNDVETHISVLTRTTEKLGPRLSPSAKLALKRTNDLLSGKWLALKGRYHEAILLLRPIATLSSISAAEATYSLQAWQWLGSAYAATGQWDLSAAAYQQAATFAPKNAWLRSQAAGAWLAAGRPDAAIPLYEQSIAIESIPATWLALAQATLQRECRLPREQRNWELIEKCLAEAKKRNEKKPLTDAWRLGLLEATYTLARGQTEGKQDQAARDIIDRLHAVEKEYPNTPNLLQALVGIYERFGRSADTDRILGEIEKLEGQTATACLLKARVCIGRRQYEEARNLLANGQRILPTAVQTILDRELVRAALGEGRLDQAREQLLRLREKEPTNPDWLMQLAELAYETRKLSEFEQWKRELRKLEGPDGLNWQYCEARGLLAGAKKPDVLSLTRVAELQHRIQAQRPAWPRSHVLRGLIAEYEGKPGEAAEAYREAIRLGEQQPMVYERLISLLIQTHRLTEAEEWYRQLVDVAPQSHEPLVRSLVQQGKMREAIRLCQQAIRSDNSARPIAVMGLALLTGKPTAEDFHNAEAALTKGAVDHQDDAELLAVLADVRVVQQRIDEAIELYKRVLKLKPTHVNALNNLATLLAEQPNTRQEAIDYIDRAMKIVGVEPRFLDTKGMILMFEGKPGEAVRLLQEAVAAPQPDPRYHFHLAVAYDRVGEAEKAITALKTARQGNVKQQLLTPMDRQMLAELERKFSL